METSTDGFGKEKSDSNWWMESVVCASNGNDKVTEIAKYVSHNKVLVLFFNLLKNIFVAILQKALGGYPNNLALNLQGPLNRLFAWSCTWSCTIGESDSMLKY